MLINVKFCISETIINTQNIQLISPNFPRLAMKDLKVTISNDHKLSKHCSDVVKTTKKLVGFIRRTFEYKSEKLILTLLNALVCSHL